MLKIKTFQRKLFFFFFSSLDSVFKSIIDLVNRQGDHELPHQKWHAHRILKGFWRIIFTPLWLQDNGPKLRPDGCLRGFAIYYSFLPSSASNAILTYKLITYSKLLQWLEVNQSPFADFHLASIHRQNPWLGTRYTLQGYFQSPHNFTSDFDQKLPPFFPEEKNYSPLKSLVPLKKSLL